MKKRSTQYAWVRRFGLCFFLLLGLNTLGRDALAQEPFTVEQVIDLLKDGVSESEIIKQIKQYKVDFELSRENMRMLIRTNAGDPLLNAIESNRLQDMVITFPDANAECGSVLTVQGRSVRVPGKHLWLFLHRRGLAVWWPQSGEILVEEDGGWMQNAFVGMPHDVGFKFELKVIWLDEDAHTRMEDYLLRGESTGSFPGIRLPDGSPMTQTTCTRVSR